MKALSLLAAASLLLACQSAADKADSDANQSPAMDHATWTRQANVYEVNIRQYSPEGTFAAFETHLPRLSKMGVNTLWLMPIQPIGEAKRKGVLGSYYSIKDYKAINPEYGNEADFAHLVESAHALDMKVILDWVPNHSAWDHPWMTEHPDFYYVDPETGEISNGRNDHNEATDWTDVAELDYSNIEMQEAMRQDMLYWLEQFHIDGFRCDMAGGQTEAFWLETIQVLRDHSPELFMLAESNFPEMHDFGFDATYGWEFHHLINEVARGDKGTDELHHYILRDADKFPEDSYRLLFIDNHDENSWNGTVASRLGDNAHAAYVLCATLPNAIPLIYSGQEVGLNHSLRFFERDTIDWSLDSQADFYGLMNQLNSTLPALANGASGGTYQAITSNQDRVFAFARKMQDRDVVMVVNFSDKDQDITIEGAPSGNYHDAFTGEGMRLSADESSLFLPAHGYALLVNDGGH